MLKHRLILGPAMAAVLIAILAIDAGLDRLAIVAAPDAPGLNVPPGVVMVVLFCLLVVLGSREIVHLFEARGMACDRWMVALAGVCGCVTMWLIPSVPGGMGGVALATVCVVILALTMLRYNWLRRAAGGAMTNVGATLFALVYIGILPGFFLTLRTTHSVWLIAAILAITKACDIGAYFTGSAIGRHKLIPWLSPGKTWEGLVGGVVASVCIAIFLAALGATLGFTGHYGPEGFVTQAYPLAWAALGGAAIALLGQFGDLTASLLKRDADVKDSGESIPGFGGVLDVLDSPLAVAPLAYWMITVADRLPGM